MRVQRDARHAQGSAARSSARAWPTARSPASCTSARSPWRRTWVTCWPSSGCGTGPRPSSTRSTAAWSPRAA